MRDKTPSLDRLQQAIELDAYEWLETYAPAYLDAVEDAVNRGLTPETIGRFVRRHIGAERLALALRCEQAAAHVVSQQASAK